MISRLRIAALAITLTFLAAGCGSPPDAETVITPQALAASIESGDAPLILDVRSTEEYAAGHIPGAVNIPYDELPQRLAELSVETGAPIVVHCQSGRRAGIAEGTLAEAGYTNVLDLDGHWAAWQSAGLPTEQ